MPVEATYNKYQLINNKTPDGGFNLLGGRKREAPYIMKRQ